jgi:hypothetical protein
MSSPFKLFPKPSANETSCWISPCFLSAHRFAQIDITRLRPFFYTRIPHSPPQPSQSQKGGHSLKQTGEFARRCKRISLTLPIRVSYQESDKYQWTEQSRLVDVNHFGAGFTLTRPVEVGRLIQLTIPLPLQLRCFDHAEPMYSVWSLVRHASAIRMAQHQEVALFRVGVGFVGKQPPQSYEKDPTLRYEPLPITTEQTSWSRLGARPLPKQRREARLVIPLEVLVETLDENGKPCLQEYTVTETLSSLGTCVPTNLEVGVGRILRITSPRDQVSLFAAIRSRMIAPDGIARLGLEFIGSRWPLHRD